VLKLIFKLVLIYKYWKINIIILNKLIFIKYNSLLFANSKIRFVIFDLNFNY